MSNDDSLILLDRQDDEITIFVHPRLCGKWKPRFSVVVSREQRIKGFPSLFKDLATRDDSDRIPDMISPKFANKLIAFTYGGHQLDKDRTI